SARAGEQVQHAGAGDPRREDVEQGFFHPIGRRPGGPAGQRGQAQAPPAAADDPHGHTPGPSSASAAMPKRFSSRRRRDSLSPPAPVAPEDKRFRTARSAASATAPGASRASGDKSGSPA